MENKQPVTKQEELDTTVEIKEFAIIALICLAVIAFNLVSLSVNSKDKIDSLDSEIIEVDDYDPKNEGKLVMISGIPVIQDGGEIDDQEFNLHVSNAVDYTRDASQKVYYIGTETTIIEHDKKDKTDDEEIKTSFLGTEWISPLGDREPVIDWWDGEYENPDKVDLTSQIEVLPFELNGYEVSSTDILDCVETKIRGFSVSELEEGCSEWIANSGFDFDIVENENGHAYLSTGDEVGDIHIRFSYNTIENVEAVTIIGKQEGNRIVTYGEGLDDEFHVIKGEITKEEYLKERDGEDSGDRTVCIVIILICVAVMLASSTSCIFTPLHNRKKLKSNQAQ